MIKGWVATKTTTSIKCDSPFVSIIYGLGLAESYACSIGGSDSIGPAFHRPISLPLKLVSFNATADENSNKLKWRTANEVNLHRFEVERSNNSKDFILIGKVAAGKNEYQYVDVHPSSSINYYRLKIIDNDGSFHFSPIVSVFNNATFSVSVFPIPAKNNLNISIQSENKQEASISIISIDGKTVLTKRVTLIEGLSNSSINIQTLPNGRYFLRAELGNKKQTTIAFEKL